MLFYSYTPCLYSVKEILVRQSSTPQNHFFRNHFQKKYAFKFIVQKHKPPLKNPDKHWFVR